MPSPRGRSWRELRDSTSKGLRLILWKRKRDSRLVLLRKVLGNLVLRRFPGQRSVQTPLCWILAQAWIRVEQGLFRPLTLPMQDGITLGKRQCQLMHTH